MAIIKAFNLLKSKFLIFGFSLLLLSACWQRSPYKGYSQSGTGLYYKLCAIGDGEVKPEKGDLLKMAITFKTLKDSVFMDGFSFNEMGVLIVPYKETPSFKGSFEEGLATMNVGDSTSFIVNADSLFQRYYNLPTPYFLEQDKYLKMDVRLLGILNNDEYFQEFEKYQQFKNGLSETEDKLLNLYLDTNQVDFAPYYNGMYYLPIKQGVGRFPKSGDKVKIHYKGYFLNGKQFESTYERNYPLEVTLGVEGQVILGFQSAIRMLNEGAKTKFVIPSHLAFGENGSSTKIVPAYTTVIYEIELLSIED